MTHICSSASSVDANIYKFGNIALLPDYSNVCAYFLDGSASAIISEFILYSNGREIER